MNHNFLHSIKPFIGTTVTVTIDRPLGSKHPEWKFTYLCNYGYVDGIQAPDGECVDAYVLLVDKPMKTCTGKVVAIVHRKNDDDDKLVVIPTDAEISDTMIESAIYFQEQWFEHMLVK